MEVTQVLRLAEEFDHQSRAVAAKARLFEERGAHEVAEEIAAGAPRRTGAYASSWRAEGSEATTDAPQANRLERGFHRVDALGRRYDQAAQPHIGPAVEHFESLRLERMAESIVLDALL